MMLITILFGGPISLEVAFLFLFFWLLLKETKFTTCLFFFFFNNVDPSLFSFIYLFYSFLSFSFGLKVYSS